MSKLDFYKFYLKAEGVENKDLYQNLTWECQFLAQRIRKFTGVSAGGIKGNPVVLF